MLQSLLIRFLLCYVMIAAIFARPLVSDKEKRQSVFKEMEDVQLNKNELQMNGSLDQENITFFSSSNLWRNGVIYYIFDTDNGRFSAEHKKKVKKAMDMWSEKTCIKFERISKAQSKHTWDYVNIRYNDITNSYVGVRTRDHLNNGQDLNIKRVDATSLRILLHEFGHVIGLEHEHSRHDRDQYVEIYSDNIQDGVGHNFRKINSYKKNTSYDYYSIMHYPVREYAKDKRNFTIKIRNPENINIEKIGQGRKLSDDDIAWVNTLYRCPATPKPPPTEPPPQFFQRFKLNLALVPKEIPDSGYLHTAKEYMKCDNESCYNTTDRESAELFITKLGSSTGPLHIGDEVLLSTHASSARSGEWILCDKSKCYSSRTCLNSSYNSSSGHVNFALNRSECEKQILKVSSKTKAKGTQVHSHDKIILEYKYSKDRSQPEWMHCSERGSCTRQTCERHYFTHLVILRLNTTCDQQIREFEILFVS